MAYEQNDRGQTQMHKGNWTCSQCKASITQLPFEPDPARVGTLLCRDCMSKKRGNSNGRFRERTMHQGDWKCSKCGTDIKELPFEPTQGREDTLMCSSCWRAERQ